MEKNVERQLSKHTYNEIFEELFELLRIAYETRDRLRTQLAIEGWIVSRGREIGVLPTPRKLHSDVINAQREQILSNPNTQQLIPLIVLQNLQKKLRLHGISLK